MERVDKIVVVMSGKGGVGKSSIADLTGPSVPGILGCEGKVLQGAQGWVPVYYNVHSNEKADSKENGMNHLKVMSIAFLLPNKSDALIWRGPKKSAMIRQFFEDVVWGTLDYLIIDTPPGTSDEHISLVEILNELELKESETDVMNQESQEKKKERKSKAILVTTPQEISLADVRKMHSFCLATTLPILGILENMSGYVCEGCQECTWVFGRGKVEEWASSAGVRFLGSVPICEEVGVTREVEEVCGVVVKEMGS